MNYNEFLESAKTILSDNNKAKEDVKSVRFATGFYAVAFCHSFNYWADYDSLFAQLKADLKKAGLKYAGSPLAKACLTVATAVIDCKVKIEGDCDDSRFEIFKELLKESGLNFSSKQADIRLSLGGATDDDYATAIAELRGKIEKAINLLSENWAMVSGDDKATLVALLSEQAEKVA
jgi:hypothetical protein